MSNVICMVCSESSSGKKLRLRHSSSKIRASRVASSARSLSQHSDTGGDSGIFCLEKVSKPQDLSTLIIQVCFDFKSWLPLHWKQVKNEIFECLTRCFVLITFNFSPSCHLESFNAFWNVASYKKSSLNCVTRRPNPSQITTFAHR